MDSKNMLIIHTYEHNFNMNWRLCISPNEMGYEMDKVGSGRFQVGNTQHIQEGVKSA